MKKLLLPLFVFISFGLFASISETSPAKPDGWSDGAGGEIATLANLRWLAETKDAWDENWIQVADIDASETKNCNVGNHDNNSSTPEEAMGFDPIGTYINTDAFTGSYDGNGYRITNLYINRPGELRCALFAGTKDAVLKRINLIDFVFIGASHSGGISAYDDNGYYESCYASGVIRGDDACGGIIGQAFDVRMQKCSSKVAIYGDGRCGGLIGNCIGGVFFGCSTRGYIWGGDLIGNLCGYLMNGKVDECVSYGRVEGDINVGGLFGIINKTTLRKCSSDVSVYGNMALGGLVGQCEVIDTIEDCISHSFVSSGGSIMGGLVGSMCAGEISSCRRFGVTGAYDAYRVGGLVGLTTDDNLEIKYCHAIGVVDGGKEIGGLIGCISRIGVMKECYSIEFVEGDEIVGGLVGYNGGYILNCISASSVQGQEWVGGCIGYNARKAKNICSTGYVGCELHVGGVVGYNLGDITNCFSKGIILGDYNVGGIVGIFEKGNIDICYTSGRVLSHQTLNPEIVFPSYVGAIAGRMNKGANLGLFYYDISNVGYWPPVGEDFSYLNKSAFGVDSSGITTEEFGTLDLGFPLGDNDENPWRIDENGRPYFYWMKANITNGSVDSLSSVIKGNVTVNGTRIVEVGVRTCSVSDQKWYEQPIASDGGVFEAEVKGLIKDSVYWVQCYARDTANAYYYGDMVQYQATINTIGSYVLSFDANCGDTLQSQVQVLLADGVKYQIPGNTFYNGELEFDSWNTAADGSGKTYQSGDVISINSETTLYAQWNVQLTVKVRETFTKVLVFPVPAIDEVNITSNETVKQVCIYNSFGQKLNSIQFDKKNVSLDVSWLRNGIYILEVQTAKGKKLQRIMINK